MDSNARVYIIACGVLAKDIEGIAEKLPLTIGTHYLPAGLHERPDKLRRKLQAAIDRAALTGEWDRIVVGYGVCGRGTVDIRAQSHPPGDPPRARLHRVVSGRRRPLPGAVQEIPRDLLYFPWVV